MIVVVQVLVFVSFSFGEVSMDSPVQSKCIGIISAMQSEVNLLLSQANIERIHVWILPVPSFSVQDFVRTPLQPLGCI